MTAPNTLYIKVRIPVEWRASYINISLVIGLHGLEERKGYLCGQRNEQKKISKSRFLWPVFSAEI